LTCAQVRPLLGAYRRDDWTPAELDDLGRHLAECAACRHKEATYRQVGAGIRLLPSITPPASLRAGVFAAIRAEAPNGARNHEHFASKDTQPRMSAVRVRHSPRRPRVRPSVIWTRGAVAVAAVLLISLLGARLVPVVVPTLSNLAESLSGGLNGTVSAAPVEHYRVPSGSGQVTGALAADHWLAYVSRDSSGRSQVYVQQRGKQQATALLSSPSAGPLVLQAVTDSWVVWRDGGGAAATSWSLWAGSLSGPSATLRGQPVLLLTSTSTAADTPAVLGGVWVRDSEVLAAGATRAGDAIITRFDLAAGVTPASQVIARAAPGHLFSDPSQNADHYYWADTWFDGAAALHSDIWQRGTSDQAQQVTTTGDAFAPRTTGSSLLWVQAGGPAASAAVATSALPIQPAQAAATVLAQLRGALQLQALGGGQPQRLSAHAIASSLQVGESLVLWSDGDALHSYDLVHGGPSAVDGQIRGAAYAAVNGKALTWGQRGTSTVNVYDPR
jgi:hypothetical protein